MQIYIIMNWLSFRQPSDHRMQTVREGLTNMQPRTATSRRPLLAHIGPIEVKIGAIISLGYTLNNANVHINRGPTRQPLDYP